MNSSANPTRSDATASSKERWRQSSWGTGQTITWHDGKTGGYAAYLGLDRAHHKAIIVLSDVSSPHVPDIGIDLLADRG